MEPGRFTLYPTQNIYTFVLLNQDNGVAWQVQWAPNNSFVLPIPPGEIDKAAPGH
jgi:hypothetical protein